MKKILSLILAFAMIFTLTSPAAAATVTGDTGKDVSGTFDPTVSISGIALVYTEDDDITYDEENKQYIVDVSADDETFAVNFMASGTGLNYYASEEGVKLRLTSVTEDGETAETVSLKEMEFSSASEVQLVWEHELKVKNEKYVLAYSNNGGETWNDAVTIIPHRIYLVGYSSSIENGSVSLSKGSAGEGETITVTATPADGYRLTKLTYTTITDGTETAITANADGDYTFEMPADTVVVYAEFSKLYNISITTPENGTVTSNVSQAVEGEKVELFVHGNSATDSTPEYKLSSLTVTYTDDSGATQNVSVADDHTFTMPAANVTVTAVFEAAKATYTVTIDDSITNGKVEADYTSAAEGDDITLTVTPNEGYFLTAITATDASGSTVAVHLVEGESSKYTFTMPAANVTVTATFALIEAKWGTDANSLTNIGTLENALEAAKAEGSTVGYIQLQTDLNMNIAINGGEFVFDMNGKTISYEDYPLNVYAGSVTLRNGTVKTVNTAGVSVHIAANAKAIIESGTYTGGNMAVSCYQYGYVEIKGGTFSGTVMVNGTANISGGSFSTKYTVIVDENGDVVVSGGTFTAVEAAFDVNGKLTVTGGTFTCDTTFDYYCGKIDLSGYDVSNTANTAITALNVYNFNESDVAVADALTLPANYALTDIDGNVFSTMASCEYYYIAVVYAINIDTSITNGSVTASAEKAKAGITVTLTVAANEGYVLESVTVTDASGSAVSFDSTGEASGIYTFTMPASAVTVTATFELIQVSSASITWGSLSFTYDDTIPEGETEEKGWTADSTDGAGTITVENTGNTTLIATAEYEQVEAYKEIYGSFDTSSALLVATAEDKSCTFTLTLSGKPAKAIAAGTKIGTVTITIEVADGSAE